jgi:hypothetical protein
MARMYPNTLPKEVLENKKLSSEIRVYESIREQVPGDYTCYYSRSWHEADQNGAEFDGEADFIVAHRDHGLLFLEVKGGRVSCRESDGQWLTKDRDGFSFQIKNPLDQARSSKHHFLKRLKDDKRLERRFLRVRHAAILPGSARPAQALAPDAPLEIVAFGDDMPNLGKWIVHRMTDGGDPQERPLGADGMEALERLLAGHFELKAHIGSSLADDAIAIERLTGEQAWILDSLQDNQEMAISGGAGSGKTVLAIEKAIRSAEQGNRTLLTCFNSPLASYLRTVCGNRENLVVASFHSLCGLLARTAGVDISHHTDAVLHNTVLPEALVEAVSVMPTLGFDTVVIDEGQDFRDAWLDALRLIRSEDKSGGFYVFYDNNQRLFSDDASFIEALPQSKIALTRNLRNTQKIHQLIEKWYSGGRSIAIGPEGEPIGLLPCRNSALALNRVEDRIGQLLRSGQVSAGQIAILSGNVSEIASMPATIGGAELCRADALIADRIVVDTVKRFKGLSRPCVFVIGLDHLTEPDLVYVAASRANLLLELAGTADDIARITQCPATEL